MKTLILVTGGTGFIGSHTCVALLEAGHDVVVLDNLHNSDAAVIKRIGQICGREPVFIKGDVRDGAMLKRLFNEHPVTAVMHFAGLKAVGESMHQPLAYYENNISGTLNLLMAMGHAGVRTMVFSSSATVYGNPASVPITEDFPRSTTNPYGATKLVIENMLADLFWAEPNWRLARLRYFNPVGAHESGLIGENPRGVPNNLMPFIAQTAAGLRDELTVFGDDYDTPDGTGVRDYIHVVDLANGHVAALNYLQNNNDLLTVNLGTGQGVSVLDMIRTFEKTNHCKVPYRISERRPGDIAKCWADTRLANRLLGWQSSRTLEN
ncbi:MAG: UDP-glucose 4-epimerase GalE, partial [Lysobacterales bacterium]